MIKTDIKSSLITVNIVCPMWDEDKFKPVMKKLTPTLTVSKLRPMLTRMVKAPKGREVEFTVRSAEDPLILVPMDNPLRDLSFYSIRDGDFIEVKWAE